MRATYKGDDKGHHKADHKADHKHYSKTTNNTTTYDHSPTCQSAPQVADNSVNQAASVSSPLAALLGLAANVAAPINAQTQAPILSCNNLEDLVDVNVSDNFQDNSRTIDASRDDQPQLEQRLICRKTRRPGPRSWGPGLRRWPGMRFTRNGE